MYFPKIGNGCVRQFSYYITTVGQYATLKYPQRGYLTLALAGIHSRKKKNSLEELDESDRHTYRPGDRGYSKCFDAILQPIQLTY